jgi:hydroxyethylthiazole kinase-like sugar kinase family protein
MHTQLLEPKQGVKPLSDLQKAATGAVAAAAIASSVLSWAPPPADASFAAFSSSQVVAEKVVREGFYGDYEVDLPDQVYDDARSTFKSAKETKTKKGACVKNCDSATP